MACFVGINVSQGSVATHARCGGIFNMRLTAFEHETTTVEIGWAAVYPLPQNFPRRICESVKSLRSRGYGVRTPDQLRPL